MLRVLCFVVSALAVAGTSAQAAEGALWDFPSALWRSIGDIEVNDLTAELGTADDSFPIFVTVFSGEPVEAGRTVFEKHHVIEAGSPGHHCLQLQVKEIRVTAPRLVPLLRSLDIRGLEIATYMGHSSVADREYRWEPGAQSIYSSVWLNQYVDRPAAIVNDETYGRRLQVRLLVSSVDDEQKYRKRLKWEQSRIQGFGRSEIPELEVFGCNVAHTDAVVAKVRALAEKRVLAGAKISPRIERHLDALNAWYAAEKSGRMPASDR